MPSQAYFRPNGPQYGQLVVHPRQVSYVPGYLPEQQEKGAHGGVCSTLFIANLGPNCTEIELKEASSVYHGFCMVKMRSRGGVSVAFADFMETEQATKVMQEL